MWFLMLSSCSLIEHAVHRWLNLLHTYSVSQGIESNVTSVTCKKDLWARRSLRGTLNSRLEVEHMLLHANQCSILSFYLHISVSLSLVVINLLLVPRLLSLHRTIQAESLSRLCHDEACLLRLCTVPALPRHAGFKCSPIRSHSASIS